MFTVFRVWIAQLYRRALNRVFAFFQADRRRSSIGDLERSLLDDSFRVEVQSDSEHDQKVPDLESSTPLLSEAQFSYAPESNDDNSDVRSSSPNFGPRHTSSSHAFFNRPSGFCQQGHQPDLLEVILDVSQKTSGLASSILSVREELEELETACTRSSNSLGTLETLNLATLLLRWIPSRSIWQTQQMQEKLALLSSILQNMPETQEIGNELALLLTKINSKETVEQPAQLLTSLKSYHTQIIAFLSSPSSEKKDLDWAWNMNMLKLREIYKFLTYIVDTAVSSERILKKLEAKINLQPTQEDIRLFTQFLFEDPEATFTGIEKEVYDICKNYRLFENPEANLILLFSDIHEMVCSGEKKHQDYLKQCCTRLRAMLAKLSVNKRTSTTAVDQAVDDEKQSQYYYRPGC